MLIKKKSIFFKGLAKEFLYSYEEINLRAKLSYSFGIFSFK